jgi:CO dehydrogenase maturation factor
MAKSIALSGKGGTGKSTIAALLIAKLCLEEKTPVLAIDADSDANLGNLLGIKPRMTLGDLREQSLKEIKNLPAGMTKANFFELGLHEIIEESKGFDLITMGRGEGSGCYCYLNSLIRKFIDDLSPSYAWLVMDNQAGLEHLSRQTTRDVDALVIVVTGNPLSLQSAQSIQQIITGMGSRIRKKFVVTNMIKDNHKREEIVKQIGKLDMEYICDIPHDPRIEEIIFTGNLQNLLTDPAIADAVRKILKKAGG